MNRSLRRIAAFAIDYFVIVTWAAIVGMASVVTGLHEGLDMAGWSGRATAHGIGFLTLTLPVVAYFALMERSNRRASLGKGVMRLQVDGGNVWIRNFAKFAPWEIAHAAIWWQSGQPFVDPMPPANMVVSSVAMLLALVYVATLFIGDRRTPYDRLAGSRVIG